MRIRRYTKNRRGAGMVEYGLLVGLIAALSVVAVQRSGDRVGGLLNKAGVEIGAVQNALSTASSGDAAAAPDEQVDVEPCGGVGGDCGNGVTFAGSSNGVATYIYEPTYRVWYDYWDSRSSCQNSAQGGHSDWLLPNEPTAQSLVGAAELLEFAGDPYWTTTRRSTGRRTAVFMLTGHSYQDIETDTGLRHFCYRTETM